MAYDINAALERLEKNLSEVESAKKQVDPSFAAVCTINSIKVVKYQQISAK